MQKGVYEYAVIRVVPRVEREEFMNVGVVLFSKPNNFIGMLYEINEARLLSFAPDLDIEAIRKNLEAFELIVKGDKKGGRIAMEDKASRFRWLTAVRSSVIQTSRPHPGLCLEPDKTLQCLFDDFVKI
ncbi:MAG TPA: DUF3037 domain-containing protein [Bacteroidia bacterium]